MRNMLDSFWNQNAQYEKEHEVELCRIVPQQSPRLNRSILLQTIDNVNDLDDVDLAKFIEHNLDLIVNNVFDGGIEIPKYIKVFQDVRFLDALIKVLNKQRYFDKAIIVRLNMIFYNYITIPENSGIKKDPHIIDKMVVISTIINGEWLPRLLGLGLSDNLANMLLIARFSDTDMRIIIKRLDFLIITQPTELMGQKMITEIIRILFDVFTDFSRIFPYFMEDVLPEQQPDSWITDDVEEVDSMMSLAMLEILDNLPTDVIFATLRNYSESRSMLGNNGPLRFSMQRLSDDFYRINNVVWQLNDQGILVP